MAGLGGRRRRRRWQLIGAGCALVIVWSTVYAVVQIAHGGLQPGDTTGVLSLPLGVIGLVAAVVALRKPIEGNDAELARGQAATLGDHVEARESAVWRQLLGDDNRRINLTYALHPTTVRPATAPAAGRLAAHDPPGPVTLPDIVTYYRATRPTRLVITGAAGAGKTVLALELLLALCKGRAADDPIPVRIPLSRWDTERQSLPDLLQQRLVEAHDWPKALAAGLIDHGMVLPVLDGLDEMDAPLPDGSPDPAAPRATAAIRALNAYQQGRDSGPLILTCRTRHYDSLATHTEVLDAARIAIAPVGADDARAYLADRALHTARWLPLLDHLTARPGGLLATVLSTPWRLCLAATVYRNDGDPAELLALPDADALDHHLLARYIPAAIQTIPNPRGYTSHDVHRWLHHLSTHLDPVGTLHTTAPAGAEATDLVLHDLWPLAGRGRVRTTDAILTGLISLAAFAAVPVAALMGLPLAQAVLPMPIRTMTAGDIGLLSFFVVASGAAAVATARPKSLGNSLYTSRGRRTIGVWLGLGLVLGVGFGISAWSVEGRKVGLMVGFSAGLGWSLFMGLMGALFISGFPGEPRLSLGGRALIRSDALVGLAFALAGGFLGPVSPGIVLAPTGGLMLGLTFGAQASRRYLVFLLRSRRRLPFRLALFLDWTVTAGLMRYSGPAYQYRHRELQHWLRQHPRPPTTPCSHSS
ncbi:NACHT domain-containing protein [Streptomyces sp. NBC_01261]|uniref:NACHT domain-containing protein n=1 Tax=Streptomyces sp. NBC_01261 TaxID=2903802 RepID=UPI002E346D5D|nr:NACHT domain-containing protein [Streptomyces sp. NBC_01261]